MIHQGNGTAGGIRDCGRFFLDHFGHYVPRNIRVRWSGDPRQSNREIDEIIEATWAKETGRAQEDQRRLFNGSLCRLVDFKVGRDALELTLGPVSYKEFLGTNLTHAYLRYTHGPQILADALGVSAALVSGDDFLVLGRRSQKVAYHPGRIHPIGGIVEPQEDAGEAPCPFAAITDELRQELGVLPDNVRELVCMGIVRDKHIVQPEMIFAIQVDVECSTMIQGARSAEDSHEHTDIVPVRNRPGAVVNFIQAHAGELTPVALATLLLHGMRSWGSGWFAAARGYLRNSF